MCTAWHLRGDTSVNDREIEILKSISVWVLMVIRTSPTWAGCLSWFSEASLMSASGLVEQRARYLAYRSFHYRLHAGLTRVSTVVDS